MPSNFKGGLYGNFVLRGLLNDTQHASGWIDGENIWKVFNKNIINTSL